MLKVFESPKKNNYFAPEWRFCFYDTAILDETYERLHRLLDTQHTMFGNKSKMKFKKSFYLYLFAVLKELEDAGYCIANGELMNFFNNLADKWVELDNDATTLYFSSEKGQSYTWKNLMGFIPLEYEQKVSVLLDFIYTNLMKCIKTLPKNKRVIKTGADTKVRYDIAKRDNCRVRVNGVINGVWFNPENAGDEYMEYPLHEILKSSDINVDHILSLKGPNKGEDDVNNMELATFEYNNWKRAKI